MISLNKINLETMNSRFNECEFTDLIIKWLIKFLIKVENLVWVFIILSNNSMLYAIKGSVFSRIMSAYQELCKNTTQLN